MSDLKKLQFVPEVGAKSVNVAGNVYSAAKDYVPESLKPQLNKVEESVVNLSAPYVAYAQDKSIAVLKGADDRVDKAVQSATNVYQSNSTYLQQQISKMEQFHNSNLESYKAAREAYLKKVEESVDFLKANGLTGTAKAAADEVLARISKARDLPSYLIKQVHDSYEKLAALEPVQHVVERVKPAVDAAYGRYLSLHDSVVATNQYKRAYTLGQSVLTRAQSTILYQKAKENLYPLFAPYADPALAQLTASPYYKAAVQHLTPIA